MKRMLAGVGVAIVLSMVLGAGVTGCAGPSHNPAEATAEECAHRESRSTGTRLSRNVCRDRVNSYEYEGTDGR